MDTNQSRDAQAAAHLGFHCTRAAFTNPAHDATDHTGTVLFTIAGGQVWINILLGEVTTVFQNSDPVVTIVADSTVGTDVTLASTVDTTSLEAGGFLTIEGDGSALMKANAGSIAIPRIRGFAVGTGTIKYHVAATKTGATKWDCWWWPLDEGATVVSG